MANTFTVRSSLPDVARIQGVWTGAGVGNCTKAAADRSRGIRSITYVTTGTYVVTFVDSFQQILGHSCCVMRPAASQPAIVNVVRNSYDRANKTVTIEVVEASSGITINLGLTDKLGVCIDTTGIGPDL
jgi:hypothetical protein